MPMDVSIRSIFNHLWSQDRDLQNQAFTSILEITSHPVDWAYDVWDDVVANLSHKDNHNRAIAAQVLCNLARSDPEKRILDNFKALITVTKDERFVTARHCMQALWKIGVVGKAQKGVLIEGLEGRYYDCIQEKNCTLIRYDILQSLRNVYDATGDEAIKEKAKELIKNEANLKYRKKYTILWRGV